MVSAARKSCFANHVMVEFADKMGDGYSRALRSSQTVQESMQIGTWWKLLIRWENGVERLFGLLSSYKRVCKLGHGGSC